MRLIDADPLIEEIASIYGFSISSVRCSLLGSVIANAPTINIPHSDDWEKYSDKLWKNAYERGKADRPQGEWIAVDSYSAFGGSEEQWYAHGNPTAYHYCSVCKEQVHLDEFGEEMLTNYCPNCGAYMKGADECL